MCKDSSKRKLEPAELNDTKKLKPVTDTCDKVDIEQLRSQIIKQVSSEYESKITKLEQEIKDLKKLVIDNDLQVPTKPAPPTLSVTKANGKEKTPAPSSSKPTFGASSFTINPVVATPSNSILSQNSTTPKDPVSKDNSPKPTFGSSTTFSSSAFENMKNNKNVFESKTETSSFGANSKFGNAFQESLKKKSFLDSPEPQEEEASKPTPQQFKQVDLEPIKAVQTGEEDETSLYNTSAKLFELDFSNIKDGWKERGVGPLHLNQSKQDKNKIRLVMRSNGLLRVILNYKISKKTELLKGLEASLNPGKYLRLNSVKADGTPIQYMLKFSSESIRDLLVENAEKAKAQIE